MSVVYKNVTDCLEKPGRANTSWCTIHTAWRNMHNNVRLFDVTSKGREGRRACAGPGAADPLTQTSEFGTPQYERT